MKMLLLFCTSGVARDDSSVPDKLPPPTKAMVLIGEMA
jgi:hypothetical protein